MFPLELSQFFQETDPVILQHMTAGKTKLSSIVRNVLRSSEESKIIEAIKKIKFSVYVDETTDPNGSVKLMTFLVRFVDPETLDVVTGLTRLFDLDSTKLNADGIFKVFKDYIVENKIPFSNILAVSCDNASVMIGNKHSYKTLILQENPDIVIIPCICHKLDLAASSSCDKTISSYIDKFLHEIVHHMNSTKRSETFQEFTAFYQETTLQILPYSKTRWLGRHTCIKRVRELYPSSSQYFLDLCFT